MESTSCSVTKGIPSVRIHPNYIVEVEGEHRALPLNQTVSEALLCGTERLPGIAEFIHLEGRVVEEKGYKPEQIEVLLRTGSVAFRLLDKPQSTLNRSWWRMDLEVLRRSRRHC